MKYMNGKSDEIGNAVVQSNRKIFGQPLIHYMQTGGKKHKD